MRNKWSKCAENTIYSCGHWQYNRLIAKQIILREGRKPMNRFWKGFLFALLIVYVVSPVDFVPGPVDDILAVLLYLAANKNKLALDKRDDERIEVIDADGTEI